VREHEFVRTARDILTIVKKESFPEKEKTIAALLVLLCRHTAAESERLWREYPGWTPEQVVYRMEPFA